MATKWVSDSSGDEEETQQKNVKQVNMPPKAIRNTVYHKNGVQIGWKPELIRDTNLHLLENVANDSDPWECLTCTENQLKEKCDHMYDGKFCYKCVIFLTECVRDV